MHTNTNRSTTYRHTVLSQSQKM